jgi:hypothetical protein
MSSSVTVVVPEVVTVGLIVRSSARPEIHWGADPYKVLRVFLTKEGQPNLFLELKCRDEDFVMRMHGGYSRRPKVA